MKTKMLTLICTIALFTITTISFAQETTTKTPAERAAKLTGWMKTNLQLTDAQVPQIETINLKYANKMENLKNSSEGRRQKFNTLKADDAAKDAELKAVLNGDQFKIYESKKAELKEKLREEAKKKKQS